MDLIEFCSVRGNQHGRIYQTNLYFYVSVKGTYFLIVRKVDLKLIHFEKKEIGTIELLKFRPPYHPNSEKKWNYNFHKLRLVYKNSQLYNVFLKKTLHLREGYSHPLQPVVYRRFLSWEQSRCRRFISLNTKKVLCARYFMTEELTND